MKKKLITVIAVALALTASVATTSFAASPTPTPRPTDFFQGIGCDNKYNGSYYYDVGWSNVTPKPGYKCRVSVYLKKNGTWQAGKTTNVPKNSSITCYSQKLEGSGSTAAASFFAVYNA